MTRAWSSEENSASSPPKFEGTTVGQSGAFTWTSVETRGPCAGYPGRAPRDESTLRRASCRTGDAPPLGADQPRRAVQLLRELGAAVEHGAIDRGHAERGLEEGAGELGVKLLAREDVHAGEVLLGERVDGDVALSDEDEA